MDAAVPLSALPSAGTWPMRLRHRLSQREFWIVQGLVVLATAIHWGMHLIDHDFAHEWAAIFVITTYAIYFVPVIYTSLYFGREGAMPTAVWAALLTIPTILFWHRGISRVSEGVQHLTIIALAYVIASRVDREVAARHQAETENVARRISEAKYRSLFQAAGDAILVFDARGTILDANAAAGQLLNFAIPTLRGMALHEVVGAENATRLLASAAANEPASADLRLPSPSGDQIWLEPLCSSVLTDEEQPVTQVLFRDVTEERERRRGLEAYARRIIQAQEEERRRVARDLHDSALQAIVLLCRQLDDLEELGDGLAPTKSIVQDARQTAESIADELRRFSRDLRPSTLDDLGLVPAVRWLVTDLERHTRVHGHFATIGQLPALGSDEQLTLFRIAQEALRNVRRHAAASNVTVILTADADRVCLTVQDDGRGFVTAPKSSRVAPSEKLGLLGMQERARLLGGTFTVTSSPGQGTCVQAALPVRHAD